MKNKKVEKEETNKKTSKIKELYLKFKEVWQVPHKRAGIKLLSYFIFFFIFLLFATIINNMPNHNKNYTTNKTTTTTTTQVQDKYIDKQKSLLTNKYNINYVININGIEYKINGTINNNIVEGYLENIDNIKKIIIKENNIYEIKNNIETILELEINKNLIDMNYVINLIKQNSAIIENTEEVKKYTYNIEESNLNIVVETNEELIKKISIVENNNNYQMNFDK